MISMDKGSIVDWILIIVGYLVTLGVTYHVAWDVPWLLIMSGMFLLGIALSWSWEKWTGYDVWYSILETIFAYVAGLYLVLGGATWRVLVGKWCGIPPCVPLFWPLLVLVIGNLTYIARPYFKRAIQK